MSNSFEIRYLVVPVTSVPAADISLGKWADDYASARRAADAGHEGDGWTYVVFETSPVHRLEVYRTKSIVRGRCETCAHWTLGNDDPYGTCCETGQRGAPNGKYSLGDPACILLMPEGPKLLTLPDHACESWSRREGTP